MFCFFNPIKSLTFRCAITRGLGTITSIYKAFIWILIRIDIYVYRLITYFVFNIQCSEHSSCIEYNLWTKRRLQIQLQKNSRSRFFIKFCKAFALSIRSNRSIYSMNKERSRERKLPISSFVLYLISQDRYNSRLFLFFCTSNDIEDPRYPSIYLVIIIISFFYPDKSLFSYENLVDFRYSSHCLRVGWDKAITMAT